MNFIDLVLFILSCIGLAVTLALPFVAKYDVGTSPAWLAAAGAAGLIVAVAFLTRDERRG